MNVDTLLAVMKSAVRDTVLSPFFVGALLLILLLERLFPVDPKQSSFSAGFFHDSVWLGLSLLFTGTVVAAYSKWLKTMIENHLGFLIIRQAEQFPEYARMALGVLLTDCLAWFQHWLKHKIPWFWQIHAVHHSQREMNLFTDQRVHFFEYIISRTVVFIPLLLLSVQPPKIATYALFTTWYSRLYHANIRSNFGILRYIFVTPQSHRIHHSIEYRHHDQNFGVIFSFWDRLFGTHQANCQEYPQTGIRDTSFPLESKKTVPSLLITPLRQLVYPFLVILGLNKRQSQ